MKQKTEQKTEGKEPKTVLKIRFALSDEPIFLEVEDINNTKIKDLLSTAVDKLEILGLGHEAIQLANVLKNHNVYIEGSQVNPNSILGTLPLEKKVINGEEIQFAEIQLLREHRGGITP